MEGTVQWRATSLEHWGVAEMWQGFDSSTFLQIEFLKNKFTPVAQLEDAADLNPACGQTFAPAKSALPPSMAVVGSTKLQEQILGA